MSRVVYEDPEAEDGYTVYHAGRDEVIKPLKKEWVLVLPEDYKIPIEPEKANLAIPKRRVFFVEP